MFYKIKYKSEKGIGEWWDVIPEKRTYQMTPQVWGGTQIATIFKEVLPVYEIPLPQKAFYIIDKNWPKLIFDKLVETLGRLWDDSKMQVVSHSSGYDSRVISMAIKELGKNAVFVETCGESEGFKKIMDYFGWKDYIITHCPMDNPVDIFKAPVGYPLNIFYTPFKKLHQEGKIDNFQIITGLGQNEVTKTGAQYYRYRTSLALNNFKFYGTWIAPFLDEEFISFRLRYLTSRKMAAHLLPVKLRDIPKQPRKLILPNLDYSRKWCEYVTKYFLDELDRDTKKTAGRL